MKKLSILFITVSLLALSSCENMLDINHDPLRLEELEEVSTMLPSAQMGIAYNMAGWNMSFGGGFWVQYWTQTYNASQFKSLCQYLDEDFGTFYTSFMVGPMMDLEYMKNVAHEDEDQIGYYYIAEALQIFGWQVLTDLYGDLPYFEALKGNEGINHPKFDTGEDIYTDLLNRIDELLKLDVEHAHVDETYDMVFKGDMDAWLEFANSLKLKLNLRISETSKYDNAALLTFIQNNNFLTDYSAAIDGSIFTNQDGKRHPLYEYSTGTNYISLNVIACKSFFDYLRDNGDPRLSLFFNGTKAPFFGDYETRQDSDRDGTPDNDEKWATVRVAQDADLIIISDWETNFRIAEVYVRAGDYATAQGYYEDAIDAIFAQINSTTFLANAGDLNNTSILTGAGYAAWPASGTQDDYLEIIWMQRWVAYYYFQNGESFIERNRTKVPSVNDINIKQNRPDAWTNFPVGQLTLSVMGRDNLNQNLPSSLKYPNAVIFRNNNAQNRQKTNLGEKVWWDKKAGK